MMTTSSVIDSGAVSTMREATARCGYVPGVYGDINAVKFWHGQLGCGAIVSNPVAHDRECPVTSNQFTPEEVAAIEATLLEAGRL